MSETLRWKTKPSLKPLQSPLCNQYREVRKIMPLQNGVKGSFENSLKGEEMRTSFCSLLAVQATSFSRFNADFWLVKEIANFTKVTGILLIQARDCWVK
jgi:hypothetical protein